MSTSAAIPRRSTCQSDDTCVAPMEQDASMNQSAPASETLGTSSQSRQLDSSACHASTLADSHSENQYATETRQLSEEYPEVESSFLEDQHGCVFDVRRSPYVSGCVDACGHNLPFLPIVCHGWEDHLQGLMHVYQSLPMRGYT